MTEDARLKSWSDPQRSSLASEHIDVDTLTRHASGQVAAPIARVVSEHLLVCEDGRCVEFVRSLGAEVDATSGARALDGARARTFQARDAMWATFEGMADEQGIVVGDLVVQAMAAYARVRGYDVSAEPASSKADDDEPLDVTHEAPAISPLDRSYAPPPPAPVDEEDLARTVGQLGASRRIGRLPADAAPSRPTPAMSSPLSTPNLPHRRPSIAPSRRLPPPQPPNTRPSTVPSRPSMIPGSRAPSLPPRTTPPSGLRHADSRSGSNPSSSAAKQLVLTYRGQSHPVDKERFLLGRSKTQADLRLDDPNVSRQHAVIERVGSAWYIVDLGSTNGVIVAGERVARRAISDGDVLVITTHEVHCSLR